jgi:hypothetical protein
MKKSKKDRIKREEKKEGESEKVAKICEGMRSRRTFYAAVFFRAPFHAEGCL